MKAHRAPETGFRDAEGKPLTLADLLLGGPVLLAFFKTTCPTCKLAWPYLQRLHERHGAAARVIGVSQDDAPSSRRFYTEQGNARFDLLLDPGPAYTASNAFAVEAVPHLALVEPDRAITLTFSGWSRAAMEELTRDLAARAGASYAPLVAADDPVPAWKAG